MSGHRLGPIAQVGFADAQILACLTDADPLAQRDGFLLERSIESAPISGIRLCFARVGGFLVLGHGDVLSQSLRSYWGVN